MCCGRRAVLLGDAARIRLPRPYEEAKTAQQILASFLERERALDGRLDTGAQDSLEVYVEQGARMEMLLRRATHISSDDPPELAAIARQRAAYREWQGIAKREVTANRVAKGDEEARDRLLDAFTVANAEYQRRLEVNRDKEDGAAALVAVWMTLLVSALFAVVGGLLALRTRGAGRRSATARQRGGARRRSTFRTSAGAFGEAVAAGDREPIRSCDATPPRGHDPDSQAVALNPSTTAPTGSADRPARPRQPAAGAARAGQARTCLSVRLNRAYERRRSGRGDRCSARSASSGRLGVPAPAGGGEVIGSVARRHRRGADRLDRRASPSRLAQAAPVLATSAMALAERRAATDALTGLPNKRAVDDSLKRMAAQASRTALAAERDLPRPRPLQEHQ